MYGLFRISERFSTEGAYSTSQAASAYHQNGHKRPALLSSTNVPTVSPSYVRFLVFRLKLKTRPVPRDLLLADLAGAAAHVLAPRHDCGSFLAYTPPVDPALGCQELNHEVCGVSIVEIVSMALG